MSEIPEVTVKRHWSGDDRIVIELSETWSVTNFHQRGDKTYVVVEPREPRAG
jgi:hypothetical protein